MLFHTVEAVQMYLYTNTLPIGFQTIDIMWTRLYTLIERVRAAPERDIRIIACAFIHISRYYDRIGIRNPFYADECT